jgi:hypothetical protein
MNKANSEGGCACGNVRYRLLRAPMYVHCCHCLDCQRQTGSAFAVNALIEAENVELLAGVAVPFPVPTESGRPHDIWRCADCGTALWSDYGRRGWLYFLRVPTLDEPHSLQPDMHIFTRSKVPWVVLPADAKRVEVYYDRDAEWPPESLERLKAAAAKAKA